MISDHGHLEGLKGRYALRGGIEIEGTARGLASFAESLRFLKGKTILPLPALSLDEVKPYDRYITAIELQLSEGKVKILREDNILLISGTPEHMAVFADDVSFLVEQVSREGSEEVSSHSHIEFYEDHLWLDPDSQPIVLSLLESER